MSNNKEANPRKRSLTPILDESTDDEQQPPRKRRKLQINSSCNSPPHCSLLSNYLDQCQYKNIYKCLQNELNIQPIIAKIIAEFSVGQIKQCKNYKQCKNNIITLHEHHSVYGTMDNSLLYYDRYIDKKTKTEILFCNQCSLKLTKCTITTHDGICNFPFVTNENIIKCDCGTIINFGCYKHTPFCKTCNIAICSQNNCNYHPVEGVYCNECNSSLCGINYKQCSKCGKYVCSQCIKQCINHHVRHWNHGECNGTLKVCIECDNLFCGISSNRESICCNNCGKNVCDECSEILDCGHIHHWSHGTCTGSAVCCVDCTKYGCSQQRTYCKQCGKYVCFGCKRMEECRHKDHWFHGDKCNGTAVKCTDCNRYFCIGDAVKQCSYCYKYVCNSCIDYDECKESNPEHWIHGNCGQYDVEECGHCYMKNNKCRGCAKFGEYCLGCHHWICKDCVSSDVGCNDSA